MNESKNAEDNGRCGETLKAKKGFTTEATCATAKKSRSVIRKTEARASLQRKQKIQRDSRVEQHPVSKEFQFF